MAHHLLRFVLLEREDACCFGILFTIEIDDLIPQHQGGRSARSATLDLCRKVTAILEGMDGRATPQRFPRYCCRTLALAHAREVPLTQRLHNPANLIPYLKSISSDSDSHRIVRWTFG